MEGEIRKVIISDIAFRSLEQIYEYGVETFAHTAATVFTQELITRIKQLSSDFLLHPECRYLPTKSKIYRNIIHGSYIVIYRINPDKIEALDVFHCSRSISAIKATRKVKI